ncbi:hypothetical protein [Bacillus sp. FSL K6-3431]|uniref:hypothetical protein n=1 Tax=Bacillus sp. FSL K6-3431 TaxID=2921500 RepID=UPI0030F771DE
MTEFYEDISTQIEGDLIAMLDEWGTASEVWDDALDSQIHAWYVNPPKVWPQKPYFSPSSVSSCPRELYVKSKGAKRDQFPQQPHQNRWKKIGTSIGDLIQREFLFIEKHFAKQTGNQPRFKFLRTKDGQPAFEDFAKANRKITYNGETFYLYGAPDGIMEYTTDDGEKIRVGLEIKSKQGTPARTSLYSMKEPDSSHAAQVVAYSAMYNCDYYVILYVNAAKQAWNMSAEQYAKTPDIRAFCRKITDAERNELFDKLAEQTKTQRVGDKPPMDLDKFTFNNFKTACALDLSDEEFDEIKTKVQRYLRSSLPDKKKREYHEAFEFIKTTREARG